MKTAERKVGTGRFGEGWMMDYRIDAEDREILRELAKKQLQYANEEKKQETP